MREIGKKKSWSGEEVLEETWHGQPESCRVSPPLPHPSFLGFGFIVINLRLLNLFWLTRHAAITSCRPIQGEGKPFGCRLSPPVSFREVMTP